jgi:uncharacterized protein (TIGR03067 family)
MVATDLVEVPSVAPRRTSTFKVLDGAHMRLDMSTVNHHDKSELYTRAIYEFSGEHLIYCVGAPGQPRPTSFSTSAGDGNTRVVLKRKAGN